MSAHEDFESHITYHVDGKVAVITLNRPDKFNALAHLHYPIIERLLKRADSDPNTIVTLLVGTGKYFSAGADVKFASQIVVDENDEQAMGDFYKRTFLASNALMTLAFHDHSKILVCALNGPVIGLSAALVVLSDLLYAKNDKFFMLFPFANLGLITEGASSVSLFHKLGLSWANEALLLSKPISGKRLVEAGVINKVFNIDDVEKFNQAVVKQLNADVADLSHESIIQIKKLIKNNYTERLGKNNVDEAIGGYRLFVKGIPQRRFAQIVRGEVKHKL